MYSNYYESADTPLGLQIYSLERREASPGGEAGGLYLSKRLLAQPRQEARGPAGGEERTRGGRLVKRQAALVQEAVASVGVCYEDELGLLATVHSRESLEGEGEVPPVFCT